MTTKIELPEMQMFVESLGFDLYFDEKRREWELMSSKSSYSLAGEDKEEIIREAFYYLIDWQLSWFLVKFKRQCWGEINLESTEGERKRKISVDSQARLGDTDGRLGRVKDKKKVKISVDMRVRLGNDREG